MGSDLEISVQLVNKFASGNQLSHTKQGHVYRNPEYHAFKDELKVQLLDVLDEISIPELAGRPLEVTMNYYYPVPKTAINTKAKREAFDNGELLPITRGTIDLQDNVNKAPTDVLQDVLGFDDSQIIAFHASKHYHHAPTYGYEVQIKIIDSVPQIEWQY